MRSLGFRVGRKSCLYVIKRGNSKGDALMGDLLKLGGISGNGVIFSSKLGRARVKCLPRRASIGGSFPTDICRIILSNQLGDEKVGPFCATRSGGRT